MKKRLPIIVGICTACCIITACNNKSAASVEIIAGAEDSDYVDPITREISNIIQFGDEATDADNKSGEGQNSDEDSNEATPENTTGASTDTSGGTSKQDETSSATNTSKLETPSTTGKDSEDSTQIWPEVSLNIENKLGCKIYELYICEDSGFHWGYNLIKEAIDDNSAIDIPIRYSTNHHLIDIKAVDVNGQELTFSGIDLLSAKDPEKIKIELLINNNGYSATVQ